MKTADVGRLSAEGRTVVHDFTADFPVFDVNGWRQWITLFFGCLPRIPSCRKGGKVDWEHGAILPPRPLFRVAVGGSAIESLSVAGGMGMNPPGISFLFFCGHCWRAGRGDRGILAFVARCSPSAHAISSPVRHISKARPRAWSTSVAVRARGSL